MAALLWGAWGDEWALNEKVSFNGVTKRITVNAGVTALNVRSDVYSAWVRWVVREENGRFLQAMRAVGADPIPGGETGVTFFLVNGWKLVYDPNLVAVVGVLYSEDYGTAMWSELGLPIYPATVSALVNSAVSVQNVVTGTALTAEQTAAAVWQAAVRTLTASLSGAQDARLAEIWRRLGLDPAAPMATGPDNITFGGESIAITEAAGTVTLTRQP